MTWSPGLCLHLSMYASSECISWYAGAYYRVSKSEFLLTDLEVWLPITFVASVALSQDTCGYIHA